MSFWSRRSWSGLWSHVYGVTRARGRQTGKLAAFEHLESREMLTGFLVTSTADTTDIGTLRWAMEQANATVGADTITFDSTFATAQTITLGGTQLPALTDVTGPTIISGPGEELLTIDGNGLSRVFEFADDSTVFIDGLTVTGGFASLGDYELNYGNGGGILNFGQLTLTHVTLTENLALYDGGSIYNSGIVIISNSTVNQSTAGFNGGGICSSGILIGDHVEFADNSAQGQGGGICAWGTTSLSSCSIHNNTAESEYGQGGGISYVDYGGGALSITASTIANNSAGHEGGGLSNYGQAVIVGSTINNNTSPLGGGISTEGHLFLNNSTVTGNVADQGGGIYNKISLEIAGSTITGNFATQRGAGIVEQPNASTVTLNSTIVAGNSRNGMPDNIAGAIAAKNSRNNLLGPGSEGFWSPDFNDNIFVDAGTDIGLGVLGNYGGVTQTIPLLAGSPAIDQGGYTGWGWGNNDQRGDGYSRIRGTGPDIGAFESTFLNGSTQVWENATYVTTIRLNESLRRPFTYTTSGGEDQELFVVDPESGYLSFLSPPDFENPSDANSDNVYLVDITVTDKDGVATVIPWTVTVRNSIEDPIITLGAGTATYQIGKAAVQDSQAQFEMEVNDLDYSGAKLVVSITEHRDAKDLLKIVSQGRGAGQISIKKNNVLFGGLVIGTVEGGTKASPNLVITFNADASEAALNALVKQVSFSTKNKSLPQPARTMQMQFVDVFGWESNAATRQINVVGRS